jgi:hypothetical protein
MGSRVLLPYMVPQGEQRHVTENYVSVPPALTITDEQGALWTIGFQTAPRAKSPNGEYAYPVLRNGIELGIFASRIERRNGRIRAFTAAGWMYWNGRDFI